MWIITTLFAFWDLGALRRRRDRDTTCLPALTSNQSTKGTDFSFLHSMTIKSLVFHTHPGRPCWVAFYFSEDKVPSLVFSYFFSHFLWTPLQYLMYSDNSNCSQPFHRNWKRNDIALVNFTYLITKLLWFICY